MDCKKKKSNLSLLSFSINPYHPKPYERFTQANFVKINEDFLVADKYWNFLGGKNTFPQLLDVFDNVGKKYKQELVKKFKEIAKEKIDSY